ncbi:Nitroreductase-like protein [Pseudomassariella vexata]|uniref:Nitroreductase-like protein n=1 Tax=Pseudomassariella vexata TaxID=1141098 RepID=A0A1Y2E3J9_9PEZI|nr:Nitroreductase-like protein [Pseudomassariella vexata]ORY66128.1 Nitroreductase-like protein [Pseudomassariella vexata]
MILDEVQLSRHHGQFYLSKPISQGILDDALNSASRCPCRPSTDVWRLYLVTDDALTRLKSALSKEVSSSTDTTVQTLTGSLKDTNSELGAVFDGVGRDERRGETETHRRVTKANFEFFGAPVGAILTMKKEVNHLEVMGVGMYLQSFLRALAEMEVGSCVAASIAAYQEVVKREVGIAEDLEVVFGIAIGHQDHEAGVKYVLGPREAAKMNHRVTFWVT